MGYGWRKIRFFSSLKSEIKCTVLSLFGIRNVGAPHWERLTFFITLRYSSWSSSCLNVSSCMSGTGKCFHWYGSVSGFSLIPQGLPCHVPILPSNKHSYLFNSVYHWIIGDRKTEWERHPWTWQNYSLGRCRHTLARHRFHSKIFVCAITAQRIFQYWNKKNEAHPQC